MSSVGRALGFIGFILSGITNILVIGMITAYYALFTYPISILFRGMGWIVISRAMRRKLYLLTGLAVLILGFIFFVNVGGFGEAFSKRFVTGSKIIFPIIVWTIYSLTEFVSYNRLRGYSKMFNVSHISILGIAIILGAALIFVEEEIVSYIIVGSIPLLVSSFSAAIAFLRLRFPDVSS
jgi:hypothetical protein